MIDALTANAWTKTGTGNAVVSTQFKTGALKDVSSLTKYLTFTPYAVAGCKDNSAACTTASSP